MWKLHLGLLLLVGGTERGATFTVVSPLSKAKSSSSTLNSEATSFLDKIPIPFASEAGKKSSSTPVSVSSLFTEFDPSPEGLVARAKVVLAADLGVQDETLLADDFVWVGPALGSSVLGKQDYLAAGRFFDLRATFPDLDYRAHDFRSDLEDPFTVRLTARTVGTMRGELRLRNEVLSPNGKQMQCPPESITMKFDEKTGKVTKLCSGFTMDRLVGNTMGLCGVMAAATVAGDPPSEFEIYPATTVLGRIFGRPVQQLSEPGSFLAPFPETVMVQLAKGIISASMASEDPDLLSPVFTYCEPFVGPLKKEEYIEKCAATMFGDEEPEFWNFRVDPYDPYRVWVDVRPKRCPPQAMSFTFDDDGFCIRLTGAAVMDPSIGDAGGLGGVAGVKYTLGEPLAGVVSRPLPQVLGRLRKRVLQPITKIGVDDYLLSGSESEVEPPVVERQTPAPPQEAPPKMNPSMAQQMSKMESARARAETEAELRRQKREEQKAKFEAERLARIEESKRKADESKKQKAAQLSAMKEKTEALKLKKAQDRAQTLSRQVEERKQKAAAEAQARSLAQAERKKLAAEEAEARKQKKEAEAAEARAKAEEAKKKKAEEAAEARQRQLEQQEQKRQEAEKQRQLRASKAAEARKAAQPKPNPKNKIKEQSTATSPFSFFGGNTTPPPAKKVTPVSKTKAIPPPKRSPKRDTKQEYGISSAFSFFGGDSAPAPVEKKAAPAPKPPMVSLFGSTPATPKPKATPVAPKMVEKPKQVVKAVPPKTAPQGVPTLKNWKQNRDDSITGLISGSKAFPENERITTSPISKGDISKGSVVQTQSGSKYFLS